MTKTPKTVFKMAAAFLNLGKFPFLVTWPISACDSSSPFRNLHKSANMAPIYSQKRFSIWHPFVILNLKNLDFLSNLHARNGNMYIRTKFDQNRIIHGWDMEIKLFSKWRPSAILNLRKSQIWSRDLVYRHMILHLCSKFRVNRPIWRRDIDKKRFSIWRPSTILDLLWRHHVASETCVLRSQLCDKFSQHSVS